MKLLLDTHILLWAAGADPDAGDADPMPPEARRMLLNASNELIFSAASVWEIAIKANLGRSDFSADSHLLRTGLLTNGYQELQISGAHAAAVSRLPPIHKDPFDRMLVAQAATEGLTLLTADTVVASYPGPIRKI